MNSFDDKIQFTNETEKDNQITFLDVQIIRCKDKLDTAVYRKTTASDLYIHWFSHSPTIWKISTLKCLIKRALIICSTKEYLDKELKHLEHIFTGINDYPKKLVDRIIQEEKLYHNKTVGRNVE